LSYEHWSAEELAGSSRSNPPVDRLGCRADLAWRCGRLLQLETAMRDVSLYVALAQQQHFSNMSRHSLLSTRMWFEIGFAGTEALRSLSAQWPCSKPFTRHHLSAQFHPQIEPAPTSQSIQLLMKSSIPRSGLVAKFGLLRPMTAAIRGLFGYAPSDGDCCDKPVHELTTNQSARIMSFCLWRAKLLAMFRDSSDS
jgi:hypothetical protein